MVYYYGVSKEAKERVLTGKELLQVLIVKSGVGETGQSKDGDQVWTETCCVDYSLVTASSC